MTLDKVHDKASVEALQFIVKEPLEAGGDISDSIMILESLTLGLLLLAKKTKGYHPETLLETMQKRVRERLILAGPAKGRA